MALPSAPAVESVEITAPALTNRRLDVNRVVALCGGKDPLPALRVFESAISKTRLDLLREADAIVRQVCVETGFDDRVWQFPVVLIPVGTTEHTDSVVLRPINSVDGMTADVVLMEPAILDRLTEELLALEQISAVFYDLTHKPPGTIEWE